MKTIRHLAILCSLAALAACSNTSQPSGTHTSRAQFMDEVRIAPDFKGKTIAAEYSKVYFAPVATANLKSQGWWASQSAKKQDELAADSRKLANHLHQALITSSNNVAGKRLAVVGQPGPDTLIVEMAITELVPAKAYWNAAATAAGFVVPGAGLLGAAGSGSVTVDGRLRDGDTGAIVATFRNRMKDKMALINVDSYSWYGGSQANLEEMAAKTAQLFNSAPGTVVTKSSRVKLATF